MPDEIQKVQFDKSLSQSEPSALFERLRIPEMSLEEKLTKIRSPNLENQKHVCSSSTPVVPH